MENTRLRKYRYTRSSGTIGDGRSRGVYVCEELKFFGRGIGAYINHSLAIWDIEAVCRMEGRVIEAVYRIEDPVTESTTNDRAAPVQFRH